MSKSPLHNTSERGLHDVVQILLGAGADVNIEGSVSDIIKAHMILNKFLFAYCVCCRSTILRQ